MILDFITWTVDPALTDNFLWLGREVRWYGIFFAIGFLLGYKIEERILRNYHAPEHWLDKLFIYVIVATVVGARLGHCLFYDWSYYSANPLSILKVWEGGLASHGGAFGIIVAILIYTRKVTTKSALWTFDRLVIPVALVGALIRLGNLMNHEIYGHETSLPWGFRFVDNFAQWHYGGAAPIFTAPSHPTQIYEAICYLITFAVLMFLYWKRKAGEREGLIFGAFFIGIFGSRFILEFIKNDQESFEAAMTLNMGQWLSVPFVLAGIFLIVRALVRPATSPLVTTKR